MIQFDSYVSNRLKPPTSLSLVISEWYLGFCVNPSLKKPAMTPILCERSLGITKCNWTNPVVGGLGCGLVVSKRLADLSQEIPTTKTRRFFFELNFARDFSNETHQKYPPASIITEPPANQLRQWESNTPQVDPWIHGWMECYKPTVAAPSNGPKLDMIPPPPGKKLPTEHLSCRWHRKLSPWATIVDTLVYEFHQYLSRGFIIIQNPTTSRGRRIQFDSALV